MDIVSFYSNYFNGCETPETDLDLVEYDEIFLVGIDKNGNTCVVIRNTGNVNNSFQLRTKLLCLQFNMKVSIASCNSRGERVHILKCYSKNDKERELFLVLASKLLVKNGISEDGIMDTFTILTDFFSDNKDISDAELIGLYGELYTIKLFGSRYPLFKYWQSKDRMKFDFSLSENLKLEIKTTTKQNRIHHFRHDQLLAEAYDIYVLSMMLRPDDNGLSLLELMDDVTDLINDDITSLIRIAHYRKNVNEARLFEFKFDEQYTIDNCHIYKAIEIPRFEEKTPDGVANAEYDCSLENIAYETVNSFIDAVLV